MKREAAIILGVLVPFALLVAAAWWWPAQRLRVEEARDLHPAVVGSGRASALPGSVSDSGEPDAHLAPELTAPIHAVQAEVERCFVDLSLRAPRGVEVTASFTPTRDGAFSTVSVQSSWQDPYLTSCIEDVFQEVTFEATGAETFAPTQHTFHLTR